MVNAEISINFEAITPVTLVRNEEVKIDDDDDSVFGEWTRNFVEYNLLPGEKANLLTARPQPDDDSHCFGEIVVFDMNENLPLMPQIAESIYNPMATSLNDDAYAAFQYQDWYIKSGLIKVTIVHHRRNKTIPFTNFIAKEGIETAEEVNALYAEKMEYSTNVMEFQSKLNSALKQRYELLKTNFIINYNQKLPQVIQ